MKNTSSGALSGGTSATINNVDGSISNGDGCGDGEGVAG